MIKTKSDYVIFKRYKGSNGVIYAICEHGIAHPCIYPIIYTGDSIRHECDGCCKYITEYVIRAFAEGIEEYKA